MGFITSVIPTGGGTLKALSALKIENPLLNITYTPKVMRQMTQDIYHGFPKSVEGFGYYGIKKKLLEMMVLSVPSSKYQVHITERKVYLNLLLKMMV